MAVIPFPMDLSPQGPSPQMTWGLRSISARHMSPLNGVATTLERPGSHWTARLPYQNLAEARRARLQTFAASCRGYASRFYLPLFGWTRRGSFAATELLTNNYFASGTTGWTAAAGASLSAADSILRIRRAAADGAADSYASQIATVTPGVPYVGRVLVSSLVGESAVGLSLSSAASVTVTSGVAAMHTRAIVPIASSLTFFLENTATSALAASSYFSVAYASLSRCALVDNGVNLLLQSDSLDNAAWTKFATTVTADAMREPLGTVTADRLIETTDNSTHAIEQTYTKDAVARDYFVYGYFRPGTLASPRDRVQLVLYQGAGADTCSAIFDLTAGTIVSGPTVAGGMTVPRASITPAGGGWYLCHVGARSTTATSILLVARMVESGTTTSYTGQTSSDLGVWRLGMSDSGSTQGGTNVPGRPMQTTGTVVNGSTGQTGGGLYLKGLPASTDGLLLQGDPVEIITGTSSQLVRARSALNSNAAGLGYLEFEAPIRVSPSDSAAVIFHNPLCRMMLDSPNVDWTAHAPAFSDFEFAAVEDTYP